MKNPTKNIHIAGVMMGTSCDGIDTAVCMFMQESGEVSVKERTSHPFDRSLKRRILEIQASAASVSWEEYRTLERDLTRWLSGVLNKSIQTKRKHQIDAFAIHGSTVCHHPKAKTQPESVQLLAAPLLAHDLRATVISNFRQGNLERGGQGAPLLPAYHERIVRTAFGTKPVLVINLGGFANVTFIEFGKTVLGFDTGPANVFIDRATHELTLGRKAFDQNGAQARKQSVNESTLRALLAHKYFKTPPPKSTGRDDFTGAFYEATLGKTDGSSRVRTALELTVFSLRNALEKHVKPKISQLKNIHRVPTVYVGGGAFNGFLLKRLEEELPWLKPISAESLGWSVTHMEAEGFAFLGYQALKGLPLGTVATGANENSAYVGAHILPGEGWQKLLKKLNAHISPDA